MATIRSDEVRIPRRAREAVAGHEDVVVLNRERAAFVIVHPDDRAAAGTVQRGRPLREALATLALAAPPDPRFGDDLEAVIDAAGATPPDPWAHS